MENEVITYPVKMYRLGDPTRTVNSKSDLDYWVKEGYSFVPQVYQHKDFPKYIFHVGKGSKTIYSQEELDEALKDGYQTSPIIVSSADKLKAEIIYHNSEVDKLQAKYIEMVGQYVPVGIYVPVEEDTNQEIEPETVNTEQPIVDAPKKRGRRKKVI